MPVSTQPRTFEQLEAELFAEKFTGHIILHFLHGRKMAVQRPTPAVRIEIVERRRIERRTDDIIPLDEVGLDRHSQSRK